MIGYNFLVLFNDRFHKFNLCRFKSNVFYQLNREKRKFRFVTIFQHMNVQWFVVVRVELENETEEYKYSWHGFFFAKIGNNSITRKKKE